MWLKQHTTSTVIGLPHVYLRFFNSDRLRVWSLGFRRLGNVGLEAALGIRPAQVSLIGQAVKFKVSFPSAFTTAPGIHMIISYLLEPCDPLKRGPLVIGNHHMIRRKFSILNPKT